MPATYPPYQTPILDATTGLVSRPWQQFFLTLVSQTGVVAAIPPGSLTFDQVQTIGSPRVLGRGAVGTGPVEELTLGTGLALTGTVLSVTTGGDTGHETLGYWTPLTDGDPDETDLIFAAGESIAVFVPTP